MMNRLPEPLNAEEERSVLLRVKDGDEEAREVIIKHNLRLVYYLANKFANTRKLKNEIEDLTSVGTIGLIKAVHSFDLDKNIKFATYASRCIENEILMLLRKNKKRNNDIYLEDGINSDGDGNELTILDVLGTDKEELENNLLTKDDIIQLKNFMNKLPDNEKEIIMYRFGIGKKEKKQEDLAIMLNISQSYVSRIEKKVINKMKKEFKKIENL